MSIFRPGERQGLERPGPRHAGWDNFQAVGGAAQNTRNWPFSQRIDWGGALRVAIVHDWFVTYAGSEREFLEHVMDEWDRFRAQAFPPPASRTDAAATPAIDSAEGASARTLRAA